MARSVFAAKQNHVAPAAFAPAAPPAASANHNRPGGRAEVSRPARDYLLAKIRFASSSDSFDPMSNHSPGTRHVNTGVRG